MTSLCPSSEVLYSVVDLREGTTSFLLNCLFAVMSHLSLFFGILCPSKIVVIERR